MKKIFVIAFILPFVISSCKKDKLEGDRSILEGKWEWVFSTRLISPYGVSPANYDTVFLSGISSTYGINFLKKGKVQLLENHEVKNEYRTVFTKFQSGGYYLTTGDLYDFEIDLDNNWDQNISGSVNNDTLVVYYGHSVLPENNGTTLLNYSDFYIRKN